MITPEAEVKVMANYRKIWGIFIAVAVTCFVNGIWKTICFIL